MGMFDDVPMENEQPKGDARSQIGKPEDLTFAERLVSGVKLPDWLEHMRGSKFGSLVQGASDAPIGLMQLAANVLPDATGIPQAVNKKVADLERGYKTERTLAGEAGPDTNRFVGQVLSPVNAIPGAAGMKVATTALGRVAQAAGMGAAGGAEAEVNDTSNGYWGQKVGQTVLGGLTGAVLSPLLSKVGEIAMRRLGFGAPNVRASTHDVDGALAHALKEAGQSIDDVPPDQLQALRGQVTQAMSQGQTMDAAAALRKADFERLNMQPTLGQVTRDPGQFAREMNLRGVDGVGEPLLARFADQGAKLQAAMPAGGGKSAYQAGTDLSQSLSNIDDTLRNHVSGLYGEARASAGKDMDVPLQGLAQDYADILHRYGDKVPSGVKNVLGDYGLGGTTQIKVFSFEDADKVAKVINANRSNDPATNAALSELRSAVRQSVQSVDASGGPFAKPVSAAAERFKLHEAVPALKAASDGSVAPDDFVKRFVVNGKTNDVKGLAQILRSADPQSFQEARAQLGDELRRAAFGEVGGTTGDSPFSPSRYMATIRRLGPDKLGAFFDPKEVQDIMTVGRVGSYMKSAPNAAPVSTSNSNAGVVNVLAKLPGVRGAAAVANNVVRPIQNRADVGRALGAEVPIGKAPLNDAQRNWLAYVLAAGAAGAGAGVAR